MKLIAITMCVITCLLAGYWLGSSTNDTQPIASNAASINTTNAPQTHHAISSKERAVEKTDIQHQETVRVSDNLSDNALLELYLRKKNYENSVALLYEQEYGLAAFQQLKRQYIDHLLLLMNTPRESQKNIDQALASYLSAIYDDIDVLLLQAQQQLFLGNFYDALVTLQQAKSYAYTKQTKEAVEQTYQKMMAHIDTRLLDQKRQSELVTMYEHAANLGLASNEDTLRLATLHFQAGDIYFANQQLSKLPDTPEWETKIAAIFPKRKTVSPSNSSEEKTAITYKIPLIQIANQFIISTKIADNTARLLIDTGASLTTINDAHFDQIERTADLSFIREQTFLTANGKTTGRIYLADTFTIGRYILEEVEIAVLDFPTSSESNGLLGMNVLQQFTFQLDQKNSALLLEKNK